MPVQAAISDDTRRPPRALRQIVAIFLVLVAALLCVSIGGVAAYLSFSDQPLRLGPWLAWGPRYHDDVLYFYAKAVRGSAGVGGVRLNVATVAGPPGTTLLIAPSVGGGPLTRPVLMTRTPAGTALCSIRTGQIYWEWNGYVVFGP